MGLECTHNPHFVSFIICIVLLCLGIIMLGADNGYRVGIALGIFDVIVAIIGMIGCWTKKSILLIIYLFGVIGLFIFAIISVIISLIYFSLIGFLLSLLLALFLAIACYYAYLMYKTPVAV